MCYGCMSFTGAALLTQKQLDFLDKTPEEQATLMEKNIQYDPQSKSPYSDQMANVENLLPIDQWTTDKIFIYFLIAKGHMGLIGQFNAIKLLTLYEQWIKYTDIERYKEYKNMLNKEKQQWKIIDIDKITAETKRYCDQVDPNMYTEQRQRLIFPKQTYEEVIEMYKQIEKDKLKELDKIYAPNLTTD